jgi:hypothetical protein
MPFQLCELFMKQLILIFMLQTVGAQGRMANPRRVMGLDVYSA